MNNRIDSKFARTALATLAMLVASAATAHGAAYCEDGNTCYEDIEVLDHHSSATPTWSAAGSVASVDEGSQNAYALKGSEAYVRSNRNGTVILRYAVRCDGESISAPLYYLRYKDDGASARVQTKLIETDLYGTEKVLHEFDSDDRPSRSGYQVYVGRTVDDGLGGTWAGRFFEGTLSCKARSYHYEVRLTRGPGGDPRIALLGLEG